MRYAKAFPLALAAVTFACTEAPERSVTEPDVDLRLAKPVSGPRCNAELQRDISAKIADLFGRPELADANALWDVVADNCVTDSTAAREAMLTYVQFTIDHLDNVLDQAPETAAGAVLAHWNSTFPYVGYAAPGLPEAVFGAEGAAGVITQSTVNRELAAANAAITVPVQGAGGDARGHLFTIRPLPQTDCLGDTNLDQHGPCFDFESFPQVSPRFSPMVQVGVCQPHAFDNNRPLDIQALGHLRAPGFVEVPQQSSYPACDQLASAGDPGSWRGGFKGITTRVAWLAKKAFSVQALYAVHGGLGGLSEDLSPFGAVDRTVFFAPLTGSTAGALPGSPVIGTWTDSVKSPGSIMMATALGSYNDTVIVMSQGGGACNHCEGLLLKGKLADSTVAQSGATYGLYEASWISLQASPSVKGAPFQLRDGGGKVIAQLSYSTESSRKNAIPKNVLRYNGAVLVTPWVQNASQKFTILVNLNSPRSTSLLINDVPVSEATNRPFMNVTATGLSDITANFRGIDSGIMGWAEISVRRLPDF